MISKKICFIVIIIFIFMTGCCSDPWKKFPHFSKPDTSYRTQGSHGYDVYIWKCLNEKRVVIYKFTSGMTCQEPKMVTASCDKKTSFENDLEKKWPARRIAVPKNLQWPK